MQIDSYLSEKHRRRRRRGMWLVVVAACVAVYVLLTGLSWMFLRAPLFRVDSVKVTGASAVSSGDVIALVESAALRNRGFLYWKAILGYRNMLVWPSSLSADDLSWNPRLASVTLSKDYLSHTITIHVKEREPFGVWCFMGANGTNENCYLFDEAGFIFARTLDTQGSIVYVVHDYSQTDRHLGGSILPEEFIPNIISVIDVLKASGVSVNNIVLKDISLQEVDVSTDNGPELYFSLRFPSGEDLQVLKQLMSEPGFGKLQYVDFRIENRAYSK